MSDEGYDFEVIQDGVVVAGVWAANRDDAMKQAMHYASVYGQDGQCEVHETTNKEAAVMSEWQPIETAPKGEVVLIYQPETKSGRLTLSARIIIDRVSATFRESTHWQPLPPPPHSEAR